MLAAISANHMQVLRAVLYMGCGCREGARRQVLLFQRQPCGHISNKTAAHLLASGAILLVHLLRHPSQVAFLARAVLSLFQLADPAARHGQAALELSSSLELSSRPLSW